MKPPHSPSAPKVRAASTPQRMPQRRPNRGFSCAKAKGFGIWLASVFRVGSSPTSTSAWVLWASKGRKPRPSATRGRCLLSHQSVAPERTPLLFNVFSQTGNVGWGHMQAEVFVFHMIKSGKSSKALEQKSGIIKCVFWEANRMKVKRRKIRSNSHGIRASESPVRYKCPPWPLGPIHIAFPYAKCSPVSLSSLGRQQWTVGSVIDLNLNS